MSYNKEDYVRIKTEFSQKYIRARERAQARRNELHAKIPEVWEIDRLLSKTGMEIMEAITKGGVDTESRIAAIRKRNEALQAKRGELLRAGGYPETYSDVQYECRRCGDTGYVDTVMCECMKRALVLAGYESSGLGGLIRTQSFDNFSLEYYRSSDPREYEAMQRYVTWLQQFAERFDKDTYQNWLLIGATGLGKTHLSTAVAKTVIERGFDVLYVTAVGMLGDFEAKRFGNGVEAKHDLSRYAEAELLIIDDLGTEMTNQFTLSCLYDVINQRINQRRCTVINTNLSYKELETRYSERITSRLLGEYRPLIFKGTDVRRQKITKG